MRGGWVPSHGVDDMFKELWLLYCNNKCHVTCPNTPKCVLWNSWIKLPKWQCCVCVRAICSCVKGLVLIWSLNPNNVTSWSQSQNLLQIVRGIVPGSEESLEDEWRCRQFVFHTVDGALLIGAWGQSPLVTQAHHIGVSTAGSPWQLNGGCPDINNWSCCPVAIDWTQSDRVTTAAHLGWEIHNEVHTQEMC